MKKTMILLALAFMLLLVGCSQTGVEDTLTPAAPDTTQGDEPLDTPEDTPQDTPQETPQNTPQETPADTPRETPAATPSPVGQGSALTEDDFSIVVEGVTIAIGADPAPVFDAFGNGGANEDNNFGLLGWTDESHTHKFYRHNYEGFYIFVDTGVATETSEISLIGLNGVATSRGVGPGDSYEDMLAQYGEPDKEKTDEGMMDCTYRSGDRTIIFILNENDLSIILIEIR